MTRAQARTLMRQAWGETQDQVFEKWVEMEYPTRGPDFDRVDAFDEFMTTECYAGLIDAASDIASTVGTRELTMEEQKDFDREYCW